MSDECGAGVDANLFSNNEDEDADQVGIAWVG
jgi:hypothetical protein